MPRNQIFLTRGLKSSSREYPVREEDQDDEHYAEPRIGRAYHHDVVMAPEVNAN